MIEGQKKKAKSEADAVCLPLHWSRVTPNLTAVQIAGIANVLRTHGAYRPFKPPYSKIPIAVCGHVLVSVEGRLAQSKTRPMGGGSVWSDRIRANDAGRGGRRDQWLQGSTHGVRAVQGTQGHPTTRRHTLDLNSRQNPTPCAQCQNRLAVAGERSGPPSPSLPYQEMALVHQNQNQNLACVWEEVD